MAPQSSSSTALRSVVVGALMASADAFVAPSFGSRALVRPSVVTNAVTAADVSKANRKKSKKSIPDFVSEAPITEAEVEQLQAKWAKAIKGCSKIYKNDGDYVGAAAGACLASGRRRPLPPTNNVCIQRSNIVQGKFPRPGRLRASPRKRNILSCCERNMSSQQRRAT